MIGLIIADDEQIIRHGLASIPWNDIGIEVRGIASNGIEALELIRVTDSKIVLTDVKMPDMDGIDLIQILKEELPDVKTILLTGYQEFEYAYSAIKYGAFEFILKPTDPDDIMKIVQRAKADIENQVKAQEVEQELHREVRKSRLALFKKFLLDLLYGNVIFSEEVKKEWNDFKLDICKYIVIVIKFGDIEKDYENSLQSKSIMLQGAELIIENCIPKDYINHSTSISHDTVCTILGISNFIENVKDETIKIAVKIQKGFENNFNIPVSIGISNNSCDLKEINKLFNEAVYCLSMKFFLGHKYIVHIGDIFLEPSSSQYLPVESINEILCNVKVGNYSRVEVLIGEVLYHLSKQLKVNERLIKDICIEIIASASRLLAEKSVDQFEVQKRLDSYNQIDCCKNIDELVTSTNYLLAEIIDSLNIKDDVIVNKTVKDVLSYIDQYYMEDISLVSAACYVYLSPIYLSKLIKKVQGKNFLEILTKVRMDKACELLRNPDLKTYEASSMVGIRDSRYFSQVFKKYFGVTPTEFRNNLLSKHIHIDGE